MVVSDGGTHSGGGSDCTLISLGVLAMAVNKVASRTVAGRDCRKFETLLLLVIFCGRGSRTSNIERASIRTEAVAVSKYGSYVK